MKANGPAPCLRCGGDRLRRGPSPHCAPCAALLRTCRQCGRRYEPDCRSSHTACPRCFALPRPDQTVCEPSLAMDPTRPARILRYAGRAALGLPLFEETA